MTQTISSGEKAFVREKIGFKDIISAMNNKKKEANDFHCILKPEDWILLFNQFFVDKIDDKMDDLLFLVHHVVAEKEGQVSQNVEVVRRTATVKQFLLNADISWEETLYLNALLHYLNYTLILAVCDKTSQRGMKVISRYDQRVYASPSRRRLDQKGTSEEMTYPNIFFMIDNFDEVLKRCSVKEGQVFFIELVATDVKKTFHASIFRRFILHETLMNVYRNKNSSWSGMSSWLSSNSDIEFLSSNGHDGKGLLELAVTDSNSHHVSRNHHHPSISISYSKSESSLRHNTMKNSENNDGQESSSSFNKALGNAWSWLTRTSKPEEKQRQEKSLSVSLTYVTVNVDQMINDVVNIQRAPKLNLSRD